MDGLSILCGATDFAKPQTEVWHLYGPFHRINENPTLALERDLELVQWLDTLGFDEVWVGEHHSAGWETISCPEIFIGIAADRTRHIRLGTGVISLPYHHPFMVANRMVLLDHLTRGRVMLGVGPGALVTDAHMLGINPNVQRDRMDEALGIILRLFREQEPITYVSDWFELHDAVLQVRPYQKPHMPIAVASVRSPAGPALAGKHGAAVLSMSVPRETEARADINYLWSVAEASAAEHGQTVRRDEWRLVLPVHRLPGRPARVQPVGPDARRYNARVHDPGCRQGQAGVPRTPRWRVRCCARRMGSPQSPAKLAGAMSRTQY